jgi:hypothetical protein
MTFLLPTLYKRSEPALSPAAASCHKQGLVQRVEAKRYFMRSYEAGGRIAVRWARAVI